jgi:phage tail-like protein
MSLSFAERLRAFLPALYLLEDVTGDLDSLLQMIGVTADEFYLAIENLSSLTSPAACPPDFLIYLAALVGYNYDSTGDPERQRLGMMEALGKYRRQGTYPALNRELTAAGLQGTVIETHTQVMRLNRRCRLNQQRLPGPEHNLGIYYVDSITSIENLAEIIARHQPAGTCCWIREYIN